MQSKSNFPQRRATRLRGYDYSQPGTYFVTTCVEYHQCLFGDIIDGNMHLNGLGEIVVECWNLIPQHYPSVRIGDYVIMPNHIHGIIAWDNPNIGARSTHPKNGTEKRKGNTPSPSLGKIVAYFKYQSTKHINQHHNTSGNRIWQRNYHDHIIRNDKDLQRLREYIQNNPMKWELDQLHPDNITA